MKICMVQNFESDQYDISGKFQLVTFFHDGGINWFVIL